MDASLRSAVPRERAREKDALRKQDAEVHGGVIKDPLHSSLQ